MTVQLPLFDGKTVDTAEVALSGTAPFGLASYPVDGEIWAVVSGEVKNVVHKLDDWAVVRSHRVTVGSVHEFDPLEVRALWLLGKARRGLQKEHDTPSLLGTAAAVAEQYEAVLEELDRLRDRVVVERNREVTAAERRDVVVGRLGDFTGVDA